MALRPGGAVFGSGLLGAEETVGVQAQAAGASPDEVTHINFIMMQAMPQEVVDKAHAKAASLPADPQHEALLEEARWMVEELRVSLFAQTLGTSRKVSLQRISKLVAKL